MRRHLADLLARGGAVGALHAVLDERLVRLVAVGRALVALVARVLAVPRHLHVNDVRFYAAGFTIQKIGLGLNKTGRAKSHTTKPAAAKSHLREGARLTLGPAQVAQVARVGVAVCSQVRLEAIRRAVRVQVRRVPTGVARCCPLGVVRTNGAVNLVGLLAAAGLRCSHLYPPLVRN